MPHLAVEDHRRPLGAPALRARLAPAPLALSCPSRVFVITGPSGVGKGTLIRGLRERIPELELSVSATTRAPRPGEEDGVDYHFLSDAEFERRVARRRLRRARRVLRATATARCAPSSSGAPRAGVPVVLEIEVQGARQVREAMPEAVQVFIAPPSVEALRDAPGRPRHRRRRGGRAAPRDRRARSSRPSRRVRPRRGQRSARRPRSASWSASCASQPGADR